MFYELVVCTYNYDSCDRDYRLGLAYVSPVRYRTGRRTHRPVSTTSQRRVLALPQPSAPPLATRPTPGVGAPPPPPPTSYACAAGSCPYGRCSDSAWCWRGSVRTLAAPAGSGTTASPGPATTTCHRAAPTRHAPLACAAPAVATLREAAAAAHTLRGGGCAARDGARGGARRVRRRAAACSTGAGEHAPRREHRRLSGVEPGWRAPEPP